MYYSINGTWVCKVHMSCTLSFGSTTWHRLTTLARNEFTYLLYERHSASLLHRVMQHKIVFAVAIVVVLVIIALLIFGIVKIKQAADSKQSWPITEADSLTSCTLICCLNTAYFSSHISASAYVCMWMSMYVCTYVHISWWLMTAGVRMYLLLVYGYVLDGLCTYKGTTFIALRSWKRWTAIYVKRVCNDCMYVLHIIKYTKHVTSIIS